jgi:2-alkenal reductase
MRGRRALVASGALAAVVLAGCGGPDAGFLAPEAPSPTPAPAPTWTPAPLPPTTAPAAAVPQAQPGAGSAPQPAAGGAVEAPAGAQAAPPANGPPTLPVFDAVGIVDQVKPAVVTVVNRQRRPDLQRDQTLEAGRGTGFFIDQAGHVVTNEHVVRGGERFDVLLADGTVLPADLIGADPLSDLAVVRIEGEPPATVAFGNSDELRQGQPVLAIGSPIGEFTSTVTDGIVSALNRDFPGGPAQGEPAYSNLIQHNAAINPGNSGGPLFDLAGRVVGVNTLGIPQTPEGIPAQGLFFAIPANTVSQIALQLINEGRVVYPYLGIDYVPVSPEAAAFNDLPVDFGAFVREVAPGGPADRGGLQAGDIVTAVAGRRIGADIGFTEALFGSRPGETVEVAYVRGVGEATTEVTLEERPRR